MSFKLVMARVRFHSELRRQSDEPPDLSQSRTFGVFDFEEGFVWLSRTLAHFDA